MDNQSNFTPGIDCFAKNIQSLFEMSTSTLKNIIDKNIISFGKPNNYSDNLSFSSIRNNGNCDSECDSGCCPPKQKCPPKFLAIINREAFKGERITVPFKIFNKTGITRNYRIGLRPLKEDNGNSAPSQPVLNKHSVTLDPGQSELVIMVIDLLNFETGHQYKTNIVVREDKINQNILFNLNVLPYINISQAEPWDENRIRSNFSGWQSHFYCDSTKQNRNTINPK